MSHRVTTTTEMKDREHVRAACKQNNVSYTEQGDTFLFTSGPLKNASLDLRTGAISGDTDFGHTKAAFGCLKQAYGEAKYKFECQRQGIQIESRTVENGNIVLLCAMA